jgi:hypothetical protein
MDWTPMFEPESDAPVIPYALVHQRLRQADEMRAFSIRLLQNNPHLAAKAGARVLAMLAPLPSAE